MCITSTLYAQQFIQNKNIFFKVNTANKQIMEHH